MEHLKREITYKDHKIQQEAALIRSVQTTATVGIPTELCQ
jgi:hypothetical protein